MALPAYRNLLRSISIAFQEADRREGDTRVLTSALATARSNFDSSRALAQGSNEATAAVKHAEEVAGILRRNVVQGRRRDEGEKFRKHSGCRARKKGENGQANS
ncbi:MAG: hypothetical protein LQ350_002791 [Teloschistes chrysophthalmus]|nr:MAG: hypothetical protein LQ350_002791 [Niorma chrysophthalma]